MSPPSDTKLHVVIIHATYTNMIRLIFGRELSLARHIHTVKGSTFHKVKVKWVFV